MQKKLIALAVAGIASTAAYAQSNVTIYGDLKPSFDSMKTTGENGRSNGVASNNSNIGFKGEENLGNGLKAIFQIESGVGIGGARAAGAPQGGLLGGRNTFVGLKGGFGEVTIGRRDTALKTATGSYDPFADSIGDYNNIIGLARNGGAEFNLRADSSVNYISPKWAGFGVAASYSLRTDNRTTTQDDNILSGAVTYDIGGLNLVGAYEKQNGSAVGGTENARAYRLGAKYNFGATSVFGLYEQIKEVDTNSADWKRNAYYVGATHSIGAVDLLATYIRASDEKGSGASATEGKGATNWNLGARYNLSKRTNVMAIYTDLNNKGNSANGGRYFIDMNGQGGAAGTDTKGFSVRVQHKF